MNIREYQYCFINAGVWLITLVLSLIFAYTLLEGLSGGLVNSYLFGLFPTASGAHWLCSAFWISLLAVCIFWGLPHYLAVFGERPYMLAVLTGILAFVMSMFYGAMFTTSWLAGIGGVLSAICGAAICMFSTQPLVQSTPPGTWAEHLLHHAIQLAGACIAFWPAHAASSFISADVLVSGQHPGFANYGLPQLCIFAPLMIVFWRNMSVVGPLFMMIYAAVYTSAVSKDARFVYGFTITYLLASIVLLCYNAFVYIMWVTGRMSVRQSSLLDADDQ